MIFNSTGGGGIMMDVVVSPTLPAFAENRIAVVTDEQVNAITMDAGQPENPQPGDIHILLADGPYTLTLGNGGRRITVRPKEALQYNGELWWPCDAYIGQEGQWLQFSYAPALPVVFTGNYTEERDDTYRYIKLLTSGTLMPIKDIVIDVFLVGGGGGGYYGGGGGGYTKTFKNISILKKSTFSVTIGAGGNAAVTGGYSQFMDSTYSADGGNPGKGTPQTAVGRNGGAGGSGGGAATTISYGAGGKGGEDGVNGENNGNNEGGIGQGTTTRAFEEPDKELFGSGGGGFGDIGATPTSGGNNGGGTGGINRGAVATDGKPNTGGGGGGGDNTGGTGGSGIIILRRPI